MNVKELYDHILKSMTAEQALMKLLEGHVIKYNELKFNEGEEIHPVILISMAALDMGWNMVIPNDNDDKDVQGLITGNEEYVNTILDKLEFAETIMPVIAKNVKIKDFLNSDDGKNKIKESLEKTSETEKIINKMGDIDSKKLSDPYNI